MTTPSAPSLANTQAVQAFIPARREPTRARLDSIDILRGIVMVVMMLDHTRDYLHGAAYQFDPSDVTKTTVAIFFTRWITHFCAPVFVFLAGTSAYFQRMRGKPVRELSRFLVKRGLWLIFLEFTVVKFAMWFNVIPTYLATLQVIWVIGVSMIVLAGLIKLPKWAIASFGLTMIVIHNAFDGIVATPWNGPGSPVPPAVDKLWILLHQFSTALPVAGWPSPVVGAFYPLIPWIGVMVIGYVFGAIYEWDATRRRRFLVRLGLTCVIGFVLLRFSNVYGDPSRWARQSSAAMTLVSFLSATKYPPSLLYLLMTLGPGFLALAAFERWAAGSKLRTFFVTFGRVPLFFYILQWITAHTIAILVTLGAGRSAAFYFKNPQDIFGHTPAEFGFSLGVVWAAWIVGVLALYPVCKWYAGVKARRKDWWLSYL